MTSRTDKPLLRCQKMLLSGAQCKFQTRQMLNGKADCRRHSGKSKTVRATPDVVADVFSSTSKFDRCQHADTTSGVCRDCGYQLSICCEHRYRGGKCLKCEHRCEHNSWTDIGWCATCNYQCKHSRWNIAGECVTCACLCQHISVGENKKCCLCGVILSTKQYTTRTTIPGRMSHCTHS